jgi:hypothetical protein
MIQLQVPYRWLGHRIREAKVHIDRLLQKPQLPRIAFSVGDGDNGQSSGLRGYELARELRSLGWRTIVFPKQLDLSQRARLMRSEHPDIVVLQKSRHPLNRPKFYPGAICVFDIDDADYLNLAAREAVIECMSASARVVAGSRVIAAYAAKHNPNVDVIWTGSRPRSSPKRGKLSPPVVAWAVSQAAGYPEELSFVFAALAKVKSTDWQFWLFGFDDWQICSSLFEPLKARGITCRTLPFMPYRSFLQVLDLVSIGLAPLLPDASPFSAGKSFGKVLGYLNCCVPIVASNAVDHPLFFKHGENGFLETTADQFAERIDLLLSNPELRNQIAERAFQDYNDKLSIHASALRMDAILRPLISDRRRNVGAKNQREPLDDFRCVRAGDS